MRSERRRGSRKSSREQRSRRSLKRTLRRLERKFRCWLRKFRTILLNLARKEERKVLRRTFSKQSMAARKPPLTIRIFLSMEVVLRSSLICLT